MHHQPLNRNASFDVWPAFDPGAFIDMNPSFVRLADGEGWCAFCRYAVPPEPGTGSIWVVRVDMAMSPIGRPTLLVHHAIDPRLIRIGDRILLFYAIIEADAAGVICGSSVALAEFALNDDIWTCGRAYQLPKNPIGQSSADSTVSWEKNWVPFPIDERRVGLIYSHEPWDIIVLDLGIDAEGPKFETVFRGPALTWDYGTIRGGTPPVPYDDTNLVTFFHSAQVVGSKNVYSAGACVFTASAPHTPVLQTLSPLLIAPYKSGPHRFGWKFSAAVVFPLGAEAISEGYRLLCGLDDGEIGFFDIRHDTLSARLEKPRPIRQGALHDYRGRNSAITPIEGVLLTPALSSLSDLPVINFIKTIAGRGRTFVDLGAGHGSYVMKLAPGYARVLAIEPSRDRYEWLKRNRAINGYDHVACEHAAMSDHSGLVEETLLRTVMDLSSSTDEVVPVSGVGRAMVPVYVLDDRGLLDVDLLKIDLPGHEIGALRGATSTIDASRPVILLSVAMDPGHRERVALEVAGHGYSFEPIFPLTPEWVLCIARERRGSLAWFV